MSIALDMVASWPHLAALRPAASSPSRSRFQQAISALIATSRAEFGAALLASRTLSKTQSGSQLVSPAHQLVSVICHGQHRFQAICYLRSGCLTVLANLWHWTPHHFDQAIQAISSLCGLPHPLSLCGIQSFPNPPIEVTVPFPHVLPLFFAALSAGWNWDLALTTFTGLDSGWFLDNGRIFLVADESGRPFIGGPSTTSILSAGSEHPDVSVTLVGTAIAILYCSSPMTVRHSRSHHFISQFYSLSRSCWRPSRFLPDYIRLPCSPDGTIQIPRFRVTSVVERRHFWTKRLGNLDGTTAAIVNGLLVYPRSRWPLLASWKPNHPSWEASPDVKRTLGPKVATYLYQGALEWIPPSCPPPIIVDPLGAVPKSGPDKYRLISDARESNTYVDDWGVCYWTVDDLADKLDWCDIMWGDDWKDAYHLSVLAGCTGELRWESAIVGVDALGQLIEELRLFVGCSPRTCRGACDKCMNGLCLDGFLMRWAVAHFGQKVAGSPLNSILLALLRHLMRLNPLLGERRGASARTIHGVGWVDDVVLFTKVPPHKSCNGLEGACPICMSMLPHALDSQRYWIDLCTELGLGFSEDKRQLVAQMIIYLGIRINTVAGTRHITPKKLEKLLASITAITTLTTITPRDLARVRGRVMHYASCIKHIRIFCASLSLALGSEGDPEYDDPLPVTPHLVNLCTELLKVVQRYAEIGAPLWPHVPSSLFGLFLRGGATHLRLFELVWDASEHGWGAIFRRNPTDEGLLLVGTWPPGSAVSAQPHREALGGCLAFEALSQSIDVRGSTLLLRNDAVAALSAFRKGSFQSIEMQSAALRLNASLAELDVDAVPVHSPGNDLIAEGIDGASREGAAELAGPAITDSLWKIIQDLAAVLQWKITIDAFATASNARAKRFFARFPEPDAEAADALLVPDWHSSICPLCQKRHREILYAFPPQPLIRHFLRKAVADGVRALILVPLAITAPYWPKLMRASVCNTSDGYIRIRNPGNHLTHAGDFRPRELALFACDFGNRPGLPEADDDYGCAGPYLPRPRNTLGSPRDVADRERIRKELLRVVNH
jgi:hypothetical protein